jgi:hypothetical protein
MARHRAVKRQPQLPLPAKVTRVDPPNVATAHACWFCKCDDGSDYVAKDGSHHPLMPHAEWFCTKLADKLGIPGIPCKVLDMPAFAVPSGKNLVFGSRWEPGEFARGAGIPLWFEHVKAGTISLPDIVTVLSWIYAFDHFVHNIDRHLTNFFIRISRTGVSVLSLDYSKAWTYRGFPLPPLPFDVTDFEITTVQAQRDLTKLWGPWLDVVAVDTILSNIRSVKKQTVKELIESHPPEWLPASKKRAILKWWGSADFNARIVGISSGVRRGSYL